MTTANIVSSSLLAALARSGHADALGALYARFSPDPKPEPATTANSLLPTPDAGADDRASRCVEDAERVVRYKGAVG